MNAYLKKLREEYHLNLADGIIYGTVHTYPISVKTDTLERVYSFRTFVFTKLEEETSQKISDFLSSQKKELKLAKFEVKDWGVNFVVQTMTKKNGYANLAAALEKITEFLRQNEYPNETYCPICGKPMETKKLVKLNGFLFHVDEACENELHAEVLRQEEEYQNSPNNYGKATVGALIGGALGAVVWILIGVFLNVVSGWVAFLISFLAGLGYDKMKGKQNNMKILVAAVVTLFYVVLSMFLIYVIIVAKEMAANGLTGNPVSVLFELMELDEEIKNGFIYDLILGIVFGIIGIAVSIANMRKTLHKKVK